MVAENNLSWPPPHSVRRSRRARNPSFKVSSQRGLEIILPMRYKLSTVADLLTEKRNWIEKHGALLDQFLQRQNEAPIELPKEIYLGCSDEHWQVKYLFSPTRTQAVHSSPQELTVLGDIDDKLACLKVLRFWLQQKAEQILMPRLHLLSREYHLPFQSVTIRNQKTRWGSCSSKKVINLNFKLIFLPAEKVRHIMVHELCHTIHLNHSPKFWKLVARYDAEWRIHHQWLKNTGDQLPLWV